ncbi:hypothetical protein V6N12_072248 [Hibiscus sabdariffa]|uniref:Uncharacterized protein n=1 Tax=Hibiscus sabdariffa TaxID=183260 RepID=A0ABR2FMJ6_9ROSI
MEQGKVEFRVEVDLAALISESISACAAVLAAGCNEIREYCSEDERTQDICPHKLSSEEGRFFKSMQQLGKNKKSVKQKKQDPWSHLLQFSISRNLNNDCKYPNHLISYSYMFKTRQRHSCHLIVMLSNSNRSASSLQEAAEISSVVEER